MRRFGISWKAVAALLGLVTIMIVCLGVVLFSNTVVRWFGDGLWSIQTMDVAVVSGAVAVLLAILYAAFAHIGATTQLARDRATAAGSRDPTRRIRDILWGLADKLFPVAGAGLGLMLTVFVAYSALRNQARLTAEIAINEDGGRIADWERESPAVRCLYGWFDGEGPDDTDTTADPCLARIVADRDAYTEAMLYIEESFFILRHAARDQAQWGSTYYREIEYWQSDVSEDLTGLFAFHLLNRYPLKPAANGKKPLAKEEKLAAAEHAMTEAGVGIENLCVGAERVRTCLRAVGRSAPSLPETCNKNRSQAQALAAAAPRLPAVEQACRAEAAALEAKRQSAAEAAAPT
jgi:hypothetical protein